MNEEVINCYLDVNPSDVEPLLLEIFDLKHWVLGPTEATNLIYK